jgi:poly-gamma-glutamate synthesis protein (capsule biosynthesis protein)
VLFTGDVMLARAVEDRVREVGMDRFFERVRSLHERASYVVVNFEASMQEKHRRSPDFTFRFSVDPAFIPMLTRSNVTHASLANNHASDFGASGRLYTERTLEEAGIAPFGLPRDVSASSTEYLTVRDSRVAIIGIEAVFGIPHLDKMRAEIEDAATKSDFQVVYVHWGNEYESTHSSEQARLARVMVSYGADAIVGHHPHVTQDIALIDGVPVFYSLGNYVFDQYFDESVTRGLTLMMYVRDNALEFELIPVATERSIPYILTGPEAQNILDALARRSEEGVRSSVVRGVVKGL